MPESAVVAAWELGLRLREHRDRLDLSTSLAAAKTKTQSSNLSSVESGRKRITAVNLAKLAKLYELEPAELGELEALRARAERHDWYHKYDWLYGETLLRYFGLEYGAVDEQFYENSFVPGPLQTKDYATAVVRSASPYIRLTEVEPRVETRMARRARVEDDQPLRITALLTEAVLRQQIGGPEVMSAQLLDLVEMTKRPHIEVRILPFSVGAYPALGGGFHVLSFNRNRLPNIAYQETLTSVTIIESRQQVREYAVALAESKNLALSQQDSIDLIKEVAREIT
ncbi:MAG TPA: helix-turn-helix transcriptional regulator [Pseudonocardiaceae bacterium]|jgi:transcriptional regulator with XRE-family HTH domain|nr:helix-turn-helix transcriptional regulator [Pseudonocardiaceae bacterium]